MAVRPAREPDVDRLAAALARAFHDDPVTCWVYANERRRPHWATRFFAWQLRRLLPQDVSWTTEDGAGGAALWALPGRWREDARDTLSLLRLTLPGVLPRVPRVLGPGASAPGGGGRFGLWTRAGGAIMTAQRDAIAAFLPPGGEALRRLDVTILAAALEQLSGIDQAATATGGRIAYTKSAAEAIAWVDGAVDGADAAFLLEPTPVAEIVAVAAAGDVMPQKSTYFYPKPLTGFVINPLEW